MLTGSRPGDLMNTEALTRMARALRAERGLTQREVAEMVTSERTGQPVSNQAISLAESDAGPEMNNLRVKIIEALSGRILEGPYWKFSEST